MSGNGGWANPAPAGLTALAVACFTFFAVLTGKVEHSCIPLLGCWLLGGFVVQLVVGLIELKEGATTGGNVFLFFSAFFMLVGGIEFFVKGYFGTVHGAPIDTRIDGWAWLVLFITLILWTPAYLKQSPMVMGLLVLLLDVAVFFVAMTDLAWMDKSVYGPLAGDFLLGSGICGIYVAAAIILNTAFGKSVIPMPGPIMK